MQVKPEWILVANASRARVPPLLPERFCTRLALQNAGSIAALILTIDCMVADLPTKAAPAQAMPALDMC